MSTFILLIIQPTCDEWTFPSYHLGESTFILGAAGVTFLYYFAFITYTQAVEPHGLSRWRNGCSRIAPVSPRRRPGGDTVAPGVFPVYHGISQPSRLLPVSPDSFKHFKTTGDMSRFNTVQHGSSRISKVVHGATPAVTRFIR